MKAQVFDACAPAGAVKGLGDPNDKDYLFMDMIGCGRTEQGLPSIYVLGSASPRAELPQAYNASARYA